MMWAPRGCYGGPDASEFPTLVVGLAVGAVVLVALAIASLILLCRKKPNPEPSSQNQEADQAEVWTATPSTQETPEKPEDNTYDDMYTEVKETAAKVPKKDEDEAYETGYIEPEYLDVP